MNIILGGDRLVCGFCGWAMLVDVVDRVCECPNPSCPKGGKVYELPDTKSGFGWKKEIKEAGRPVDGYVEDLVEAG